MVAKRIFDFLAAFLGLIFLAPLFMWIAIRIRLESPGPVLYRGLRLGKNGKPFSIYKFRTMYDIPASHNGMPLVPDGDWRITSFGAWLRQAKWNELPQLLNVLKGEMSLVGPRPEDPDLANAWPDDLLADILVVKPGITSLASIIYRNEPQLWLEWLGEDSGHRFMTEEHAPFISPDLLEWYAKELLPNKVLLDSWYVRRRSFWLDLAILTWTITVIFQLGSDTIPGFMSRWLDPDDNLVAERWITSNQRNMV